MKEINLPSGEYLLAEVPDNYWCFHINDDGFIMAYPQDGGGGTKPIAWHTTPPPGKWLIVGKACDMLWWQKVGIIEHENDGSGLGGWWFKNYTKVEMMTKSADESLESLISFHSMKPETTLILRKQPK